MADSTPRILVRLVDQLADGMRSVTDNVRRHALRARGHATVHDEHPVVLSIVEVLDEHLTRELSRDFPRTDHGFGRVEPSRDAAAVARVDWLEDHRVSDLAGEIDRAVERAHGAAARHGQTNVAEEALRVFLVLRDLD